MHRTEVTEATERDSGWTAGSVFGWTAWLLGGKNAHRRGFHSAIWGYADSCDLLMSDHKRSGMNGKSVQDSALLGHFAKSDIRYWQESIFRQTYTRYGQTLVTKDWAM
jgi:hypothetical protein